MPAPPESVKGGWKTMPPPAGQAAPPSKARRRWLVALGLVLLVGLGALGLLLPWRGKPRPVPPLRLHLPAAVTLRPGESKSFSVRVERAGYSGPVELASAADEGVTATAAAIPPDASEGEVRLKADPKAALGPRHLTFHAAGEGQPETVLKVHVLPSGCEPVRASGLDRNGTPYYARIVRRLDDNEVVFVLLRPGGNARPFYLMENKVWNGLYRAFARAEPGAAGSTWQRGGVAAGRDLGSTSARLPVLRVTRPQAERCAAWLGGRLPSAAQLDWAAGLGQKGEPTGHTVARRADGPRPVTDPTSADVSPAGIRDLAGNGREWTRDNLQAGGEELAVLRGRSYTAPGPLLPADLEAQRRPELTPTQYPSHASPYTGFRVVIELPAR
jgi:hypothetical protein